MKKKLVHLFFAALMIIGVVGCKEHEQSELDFAAVQDTAYVMGKITYSLGQDTLSNDYVAEVIKPAVGRKIYVDVPLSSYQAGAQGNKIFTGVVDSLGNVTIAIPVKSDGISGATLRYEEFTAERAEYLKMVAGKPVFEVRMNKFETPGAIASLPTLLPGTNSIGEEADLRYAHTVIDMKDYAETAVLSGKLMLPYESSYRVGAYKAAANCQIEVTIKDGEDVAELGLTDALPFTYGCVTNEKGEFALKLPVKNLREGFRIVDATVVPLGATGFTHYVDATGKTETLSGAYKLRTNWEVGVNIHDVAEVVEGIECSVGECPLVFVPGYNNGIAEENQPATWNADLAGWVFGEKEFANMTATAKISGSVVLAQETAFAVGTYAASTQSVTLTGSVAPYNKSFTVLSTAAGLFELEIPVEQEGVNPGVEWTVELVQPTSIAYTHYQSESKSVVFKEGQYSFYAKSRDIESEWNQLGTYHYKFTPNVTLESWSNDLAGWFVKESYNETAVVSANLYLAKETAFAVGAYESAKGRRVSVQVVYPDETVNLVAPVKADGTFAVTIPVESSTSKYTVDNFTLLDDENDDFKHYTKDANKGIAGTYTVGKKLASEDGDWNNKWNIYYTFNPTTAPETWTSNLAGWFVKEKYEEAITVTAKVYVAEETALAIGGYKAAQGLRVSVDVVYPDEVATLVAPVKADGTLTLVVPAKSATSEYTANVFTLIDHKVEDFKHFTKKGEKTLAGEYSLKYMFEDKEGDWNNKYTLYYSFAPTTAPTTWHADLAGWYKKDGYNKSATATGKAYFAKEKSYAIGEYVAAANEVVTVHVVDLVADLQVPVKADGTISVVIPMKDEYDEYTLIASAAGVEVDDFVHYKDHGKTQTLEGEYIAGSPLKADEAAWNDLGTYYFKFDPKGTDPETYTDKLFGWQKYDEAKFPNKDMMITGAIKMAAETGFWKGTYESYANEKVTVKYTLHGVDFEMVVLSDTEGAVECQAYRTFADDAPAVSIEPMKKHVKNYIHYYHATSPAPEKLEGNYSLYITDKASTAKWNVAGTKYYKFTPSSTANDWSNDLVGWYVVPQKKDNAQFKLYAQKAIETSTSNNHEAKWTNASNVKAHVYVGGQQFDMVVSGKNLSFTLPTAFEIEDGVTTYQVTITLENEPNNSTQFTHYPDPAANNTEVLIGSYKNYGNIYNRSVVAEGKKFEIKESAKMMFYENGYLMPSGYSWDFSAEHDAI